MGIRLVSISAVPATTNGGPARPDYRGEIGCRQIIYPTSHTESQLSDSTVSSALILPAPNSGLLFPRLNSALRSMAFWTR